MPTMTRYVYRTRASKEPLPKRRKLQIDDSTTGPDETREDFLSPLNQCYIDEVAKNLDLKSLVRLQLTCKNLFQKKFVAQRLVSHDVDIVQASYGPLQFRSQQYKRTWSLKQFNKMAFRFHATELSISYGVRLTANLLRRISEALEGRGTITKLTVRNGYDEPMMFNPSKFARFLQDFDVSEMKYSGLTLDFFHLPAVKQLKSLGGGMYGSQFPLSLLYFLDTDIHTCAIRLGWRDGRDHPDSEEMNVILQKWAENEKVIRDFTNNNFYWDEESIFFGWDVILRSDAVPPERPIVIRTSMARWKYRVIRADGAALSVVYGNGTLRVEE